MKQHYRVAVARQFGAPEVISIENHPVQPLAAGEVRVAVRAAGQNPVDARRRAGNFGGQVPLVFGTEFSGIVHESKDPGWAAGDEVVGWGAVGADADLVLASGDKLAAKPKELPWAVAGGLSGAGQTSLTALAALELQPGDVILVHAAAGGLGSMLVQLAMHQGLVVIGTAGTGNQEYLRQLGVLPVVYGPGLSERVAQAAGGRAIAASIDLAGSMEAGDLARELASGGAQCITLVPETWQSHGLPLVSVRASAQRFAELVRSYRDGGLQLQVNTLEFNDVVKAHRQMDAKHSRGKLVLEMSDNPYLANSGDAA
ncbi:NADP-dependent oxidoreductase [Glutamicibacter sp. NPDC055491]